MSGPLPGSTPLYSAAESREADRYTIEDLGIPGIVLMEHAGRAVALRAEAMDARRALIVCGPGNNGGDGWVVARHLLGFGLEVELYAMKTPVELTGDARKAAEMYLHTADARGWPAPRPSSTLTSTDGFDLVVDALFGTGLGRPLAGEAARLVQVLNDGDIPILAVDLPSGLYTEGQAPDGPHVVATRSMTFGGLKIAHCSEPTADACGEVEDARIGIFPALDGREARVFLPPDYVAPAPPTSGHKGHFGHVGVLIGATGTRGAATLAAYAALRAGAGKASVLGADEASLPEIMTRPRDALDGLTALVVGPGLRGEAEAARPIVEAALERDLPLVVDAEGIELLLGQNARAVATPHPGEAARVLGRSNREVQSDRVSALFDLADLAAITWVLKGAHPLVGDVERAYVVAGGNPALAVGGSGDVLAGVVGAHLARGEPPLLAALHASQRHQAAGATLERGAIARDIADALAR
jgi:NAD(P)H-hydrate epimerase